MMRNIDIDLLRSFVMVYESGSFSFAADKLGRTQSTISQQIKKLEDILGKNVFIRNNRSVNLTPEGEVLLSYARQMISINDEVIGRISQPDISGTVRLGAPEAFATNYLPEVLMLFSKSHPSVALDVQCDLSHHLLAQFEKGEFDLILIKKDDKTKTYGNKVWRETLVWVGLEKKCFKMGDDVPLILSPIPCVYRNKVVQALEKKNIKWHSVFTSASMAGRIAAAKAGLGFTAIPKEMLSHVHGLSALGDACGLPPLSPVEIDLLLNKETKNDAAKRLADHIIFALEDNPSMKSKK